MNLSVLQKTQKIQGKIDKMNKAWLRKSINKFFVSDHLLIYHILVTWFTNKHSVKLERESVFTQFCHVLYKLILKRNAVQFQPAVSSSHTKCLEEKGATILSTN